MRKKLSAHSFQLTAAEPNAVSPSGGTGGSASQGGVRTSEPRFQAGQDERGVVHV